LAKENGYKLFETSAKSNTGVEYMFTEIAKMMYENPPKSKRKDTIPLKKINAENKSIFSKVFGSC